MSIRLSGRVPKTEEAKRTKDFRLIRTRRVICNKGDDAEPDIRARLVACEVNENKGTGNQGFFASTPPLEALKILLSDYVSRRWHTDGTPLQVSVVDIKQAYFHATPDGRGEITKQAQQCRRNLNLQGLGVVDLRTHRPNGGGHWDLSLRTHREEAWALIEKENPDWVIIGPPCTQFSSLQNLNHPRMDPDRVKRLLREARGHLKLACRLYRRQIRVGNFSCTNILLLPHPGSSQRSSASCKPRVLAQRRAINADLDCTRQTKTDDKRQHKHQPNLCPIHLSC